MARIGWPKLLGVGAVLVAVSLAMSGCATIAGQVTVQSEHNAQVARKLAAENKYKPSVGDCWQTTYGGRYAYYTWTTEPPVSCSKSHELYTYAVLTLKHTYTGPEFDSDGDLEPGLDNDSFNVCDNYLGDKIGELDPTDERLNDIAFLPRPTEWNLGARWVRCDISIYKLGTPIDKPALIPLPSFSTLKSEISKKPGQFDNCVNVPAGEQASGPFVKGAVLASCANPDWTLERYVTFPYATPSSYPTATVFNEVYEQQCEAHYTDATHMTFLIYPSKSQWDDGDKDFECWVGKKA